MTKPTLIACAALAVLTLSTAGVARAGPSLQESSLARARALFKKVDANADGFLSAMEAGRNKIPTRDFVSHDTDRDRRLSGEEFVVFYRHLLVRAGRGVSPDLEAEAARIEAELRSRHAEEARRTAQARERITTKPVQPVATVREQARQKADRDKSVAPGPGQARQKADRSTTAPVVPDQAQPKADGRSAVAAVPDQAQPKADRRSAAAAVPDQAQPEADRRAELNAARRVAAARERELRERVEAAGTQDSGDGKAGQTPEERAQAFVKRLVAGGRLTTDQARDFYAVLLAKVEADQDGGELRELRSALRRAKGRIGPLIVKGDLTAEEGRQLAATMDARVKRILGEPEGFEDWRREAITTRRAKPTDGKPADGAPGSGRAGLRSGGAGAVTEPKDGGVRRPGQKPASDQPATKQPASKQPTGKQPTGKQPTGKQPTGKQPTGKQPTGKQPQQSGGKQPQQSGGTRGSQGKPGG